MELREVQNFNPQNQAGGKCTFCRQHKREVPNVVPVRQCRVFSTGVRIDYEGVIEVCEICLRGVASQLGFEPPEQLAAYAATAQQLDSLLDDAQTELDEKSATIRSLSRELATAAEQQGAKVAAAYDRGWQDGLNQENVPEVPEPSFDG